MKTQIPEWLIEMSEQMNSDPNRCTSHPFWQVRNKIYLVTKEGYNEHHWEIYDTNEGVILFRSDRDSDFSDLAEDLNTYHPEWCLEWLDSKDLMGSEEDVSFLDLFNDNFDPDFDSDDLPYGYEKFHMQEIEEVLTTHLTQAGALQFIQRKKHDYPNAYTYVESAYWSPQLRQLQDWIKGLTQDSSA